MLMMDNDPGHDAMPDDMLVKAQGDFMTALQKGPDHLPEHMFSGSAYRAFIGVKAHANTISHARLVALEETFPRLRTRLGDEQFNALSRIYVETAAAQRCDINGLGADFADFITGEGVDASSVDLARIEWLWLESYHAADAEVLTMQDIAALDEEGLMATALTFHPSVRHIILRAPLAPELGLELPDDFAVAALSIVRQDNDVLVHPQNIVQKDIFQICEKSVLMRNLLEQAIETHGEALAIEHVFALIGAGFLANSGKL
jgi:hypothetical protein